MKTPCYQQTIARSVSLIGVGLHSGKKVAINIDPAPADTGIVFSRMDRPGSGIIKACPFNVTDTTLATTISNEKVGISTVEHLTSALFGLGIDNVTVEVDGCEVPIMDGSAAPFVRLLLGAGIVKQERPKKRIKFERFYQVSESDRVASIYPSEDFRISYTIDFPGIPNQSYQGMFNNGHYIRSISQARTFCLMPDVEHLRRAGLGLGGSLNNALVFEDGRVLNKGGLRFRDEPVRHKVLDAIGDLSLCGGYVVGHLVAYKSGHSLNIRLLSEVLSDPKMYSIEEITDESKVNQGVSLSLP